MTNEEVRIYHSLYCTLHRAHREAPSTWTDYECNRVLTAIMAAKEFSWRVVGITNAALQKFAELDFRYRPQNGLTRAHLTPRIATVRALLAKQAPISAEEFITTWLANDRTILCAKGENKNLMPDYIPIENNDGLLFSCHRILAGWRHGKNEREYLRELFDKTFSNKQQ